LTTKGTAMPIIRETEERTADNERRANEERERFVARAIKRRRRCNYPLDPRQIAFDAIVYAENGTSYLEWQCARDGVAWPGPVLAPFLAEVERQLAAATAK
jgi:hypothetical protein